MSVPGQIIDTFLADKDIAKLLDQYAFARLTSPNSKDAQRNLIAGLELLLIYHKAEWLKSNNIRSIEFARAKKPLGVA